MPVNKSARFRFEIIDECLRNTKKKWSKNDLLFYINRRLELHFGDNTSISVSQLRYDLENMQSEYSAPIEMYRIGKGYYYRYEEPGFSIKNIPVEEEDIVMLNEAVHLLRQIKGFKIADDIAAVIGRLENRFRFSEKHETGVIYFDAASEARGNEYLEDVYHAIINKNVLKLTYYEVPEELLVNVVHPYLLREYVHHWYLAGYCQEQHKIGVFSLDRIKDIRVSRASYIANTFFTGDDHFKNIIGVTMPEEGTLEDIDLVFCPCKSYDIVSNPLHHSQQVVKWLEDGCVHLSLKLIINPELVSLLLGFGENVQILKPFHLAEKVKEAVYQMCLKYDA